MLLALTAMVLPPLTSAWIFANLFAQFEAVLFWHTHIENDQVGMMVIQDSPGFGNIGGLQGNKPGLLQHNLNQTEQTGIMVDNEYLLTHSVLLS